MRRRGDAGRVVALSALLCLVWAGAWAQGAGAGAQPAAQTSPVPAQSQASATKFSVQTELVLVPVTVTDKSQAPVLDLHKEDFRVLENGKQQTIKVFDEVHPEAIRAVRPLVPENEFTNVLTEDTRPQRLEIVVFDTVNTPFIDQAYAREQLVAYLARNVEPGRLVSLLVVNWQGLRMVHDFTSDTSVLIAALRKVAAQKGLAESAVPSGPDQDPVTGSAAAAEVQAMRDFLAGADAQLMANQESLAQTVTLSAFESIAQAYAGLPGRKSLIWATVSFPFRINLDNSDLADAPDLSPLYKRALRRLSDANIAMYPVDVRGLVDFGMSEAAAGPGGFVRRGDLLGRAMAGTTQTEWDRIAVMKNFAAMTGGRAFYNRNDVSAAFQEARRESSAYYMLGYYLEPTDTAAGWRKLKVQVLRKDVAVRSRSGFFVTRAAPDAAAARRMEISLALRSPLDYTALPLKVRWMGMEAHGEKRRIRFEVELAPDSATIDEDDGNHIDLEFIAVAKTGPGEDAAHFDQTFDVRLKPESLAQIRSAGITYRNSLEVAPGNYAVRFVVRDSLSGRMGSVGAPLKVE